MPIIKQAIKRMKQDVVKRQRNNHFKSRMKSLMKLMAGYIKAKDADNANKTLPEVIKSIDTCTKKNIIHKNNAARKKSGIQKALNGIASAK